MRVVVNGELRAAGARPRLLDRVRAVADLLPEQGETVRSGDWIITGSVVEVANRARRRGVADRGQAASA